MARKSIFAPLTDFAVIIKYIHTMYVCTTNMYMYVHVHTYIVCMYFIMTAKNVHVRTCTCSFFPLMYEANHFEASSCHVAGQPGPLSLSRVRVGMH